jgi:hypothetical protein
LVVRGAKAANFFNNGLKYRDNNISSAALTFCCCSAHERSAVA